MLLASWMVIYVIMCVNGMQNVVYKYFSKGDEITLTCNFKAVYWHGPSYGNDTISYVDEPNIYGELQRWNISFYTKENTIAQTLPLELLRRLNLVGDNLDLHITNLSHSDEGIYLCDTANFSKPHRYLLQNRLLPSELQIQNVTDNNTFKGIENSPLDLVCIVKSGKPPEVLSWKKDRAIIAQGGPHTLVYSFIPNKTDHQSVYSCEVKNADMEIPLSKIVHLDIKYKPLIMVNVSDTFIMEGEEPRLCCISKSNPKPTSITWSKEEEKVFSSNSESVLCYTMTGVIRNDTGNYTCSSQNEIGNESSTISIVVSYAPDVNVLYRNLTEEDSKRAIQCLPKGEPNVYTYFQWEHLSVFHEHIRYLKAKDDGILYLPYVNISNRYQDTGFYLCNVSNGVPDYHGNIFQQGTLYFASKGPPVFAANNTRVQYYSKESAVEIRVNVYSSTKIICQNITEVGSFSVAPKGIDVKLNPIRLEEIIHDAIITVKGTGISFILDGLNYHGSCQFNVTVCNSYGQSSFVVELKYVASRKNSKRTTTPTAIIVTTIILTLLLIPLLVKCVFIVRDSNKDETVEEDSEVVEGLSESVANRLYHSVQREMNTSQIQDEFVDDGGLTVTNTGIYNNQELTVAMESRLNYADVIFQPSSSTHEGQIIGLEDRIHYADVDVSARTVLQTDNSSVGSGSNVESGRSSSEDDFVDVGSITNYIQNRTTNI